VREEGREGAIAMKERKRQGHDSRIDAFIFGSHTRANSAEHFSCLMSKELCIIRLFEDTIVIRMHTRHTQDILDSVCAFIAMVVLQRVTFRTWLAQACLESLSSVLTI
jgi:hypothetical protein